LRRTLVPQNIQQLLWGLVLIAEAFFISKTLQFFFQPSLLFNNPFLWIAEAIPSQCKLPVMKILCLFLLCCSCFQYQTTAIKPTPNTPTKSPLTVGAIPLPKGYERVPQAGNSFSTYLRQLGLKKDKTVYLYNGQKKYNQQVQYAVVNISTGNKDLQQCADAVMRLRAEYLFIQNRLHEIDFTDNNQRHYPFKGTTHKQLLQYLEKVYAMCGSLSLSRQLKPVTAFATIAPGDVLIKGGAPGHAMMVMDVAQNNAGQKVYLLAQSYMPAQDIHVVINPVNFNTSPWYTVTANESIITTPEWQFTTQQLKRW
jgi:Domain of unknown function (4846)